MSKRNIPTRRFIKPTFEFLIEKKRDGGEFTQEDLIPNEPAIVVITRDGYLKRVSPELFKTQGRGGKGHIAIKLRDKDKVARMRIVEKNDELLFVTAKGTMSRQTAAGISTQGRYAKGVRIQRVDEGDYIVDLAQVVSSKENELTTKD